MRFVRYLARNARTGVRTRRLSTYFACSEASVKLYLEGRAASFRSGLTAALLAIIYFLRRAKTIIVKICREIRGRLTTTKYSLNVATLFMRGFFPSVKITVEHIKSLLACFLWFFYFKKSANENLN